MSQRNILFTHTNTHIHVTKDMESDSCDHLHCMLALQHSTVSKGIRSVLCYRVRLIGIFTDFNVVRLVSSR
jgi:hypothetical protein